MRARPRFLVSVRVLSRLFRRLFLEALEQAHRQGELEFHEGVLSPLRDLEAFRHYLQPLRNTEWVVYMKPPFGSPAHVIDYPGRYTHRVAIGEQRLLSQDSGHVSFLYKDYRSSEPQRSFTMTLEADEFVRRFLLHVLPDGFQRIRHYGLLSNRFRAEKLVLCRALLVGARPDLLPEKKQLRVIDVIIGTAARCPVCGVGTMTRTLALPAQLRRCRSPDQPR